MGRRTSETRTAVLTQDAGFASGGLMCCTATPAPASYTSVFRVLQQNGAEGAEVSRLLILSHTALLTAKSPEKDLFLLCLKGWTRMDASPPPEAHSSHHFLLRNHYRVRKKIIKSAEFLLTLPSAFSHVNIPCNYRTMIKTRKLMLIYYCSEITDPVLISLLFFFPH